MFAFDPSSVRGQPSVCVCPVLHLGRALVGSASLSPRGTGSYRSPPGRQGKACRSTGEFVRRAAVPFRLCLTGSVDEHATKCRDRVQTGCVWRGSVKTRRHRTGRDKEDGGAMLFVGNLLMLLRPGRGGGRGAKWLVALGLLHRHPVVSFSLPRLVCRVCGGAAGLVRGSGFFVD